MVVAAYRKEESERERERGERAGGRREGGREGEDACMRALGACRR